MAGARLRSGSVGNLLLLAASLGLVFAALEVGLRLRERENAARAASGRSWAIHDADLGYRPRPHFEEWNELGLKDEPIATPKQRFRILLLGDSVPFYGVGADDTFPAYMERALREDPTLTPSEVVNAGVRGYTNYQELVFLEKFGLALEPDLVGVSFVLNDLHRILHQFKVVNGEIVGQQDYSFESEAVESVESPLYRLAAKSHFLVWLRHELRVFDSLIDLYAADGFTFDFRPDFSTAWQDEPWRDVERQLGRMRELGREHGFGVFLVVFPFGEQLRPDYLARDPDYVKLPQRRLAEITTRLGIPYLDLFGALDRARDVDPDGIHLTAAGRARAGALIARFLVEQGLVPRAAGPPPSAPRRAVRRPPRRASARRRGGPLRERFPV